MGYVWVGDLPQARATHRLRGRRGQRYHVQLVREDGALLEVENVWTGERVKVLRSELIPLVVVEEGMAG